MTFKNGNQGLLKALQILFTTTFKQFVSFLALAVFFTGGMSQAKN